MRHLKAIIKQIFFPEIINDLQNFDFSYQIPFLRCHRMFMMLIQLKSHKYSKELFLHFMAGRFVKSRELTSIGHELLICYSLSDVLCFRHLQLAGITFF